MRLRKARPGDMPAVAALIHTSVTEGAAGHYDAAQCAAWSPAPIDPAVLARRLAPQFALLAEDGGGLAGVMSLGGDGTLDFAYVRPDRRGGGTAGMLYDLMEPQARATGVAQLRAKASHMLRPFLMRRGWRIVGRDALRRGEIVVRNWRMTKDLPH